MSTESPKSNSNKTKLPFAELCGKMKTYQNSFIVLAFLIVTCAVGVILSKKPNTFSKLKLIIDVDAGSDDAMALLYLLRAEKYAMENKSDGLKILGITCGHGNTALNNVLINVLKTLKIANRLDIPVYKGAEKSLIRTRESDNYYGVDGLGDIEFPNPPSLDLIQSEHAVTALVRMVNENPGEVTLLATGPLTNIALAIRMDNNFLKKLKKFYILGGCIEGKGNIVPGVEFNFFMDPEANYIVLNGTEFNPHLISLLSWEPTLVVNATWEWRRNVLGKLNSTEMLFMNKVEHIENNTKTGVWGMADVILASIAIQRDMVGREESYGIEAITEGPTRGGITVDYFDFLGSKQKIDVIYDVNTEMYKDTLIEHFS